MRKTSLEFGKGEISFNVPDSADILSADSIAPLDNPADAIAFALAEPIDSPSLAELAKGCKTAAIVISDNTRPVPYKGPSGILRPIIQILQQADIADILIIVATGTHRSMTGNELRDMLDPIAFSDGVRVINHVCDDNNMLRNIGSTKNTPEVTINKHYLDAELKIVTGLVEPHFMAGYSGGRKSICPGISGQSVTFGFHGAKLLAHPGSNSLILEGNPCHEEALAIAKMTGVDFAVNVTVDFNMQLVGVFAGDLEKAHLAAVEHCNLFATVAVPHRYDIVITHSGHVGMNHYQCCKAAYEAARVVNPDGCVILAANLCDVHPIGSKTYQKLVSVLVADGWEKFRQRILSDDWTFTVEQWGTQKWSDALAAFDAQGEFFTCAPQLEPLAADAVCEKNAAAQYPRRPGETDLAWTSRMVQEILAARLSANPEASVLVLPNGPYSVPDLERK